MKVKIRKINRRFFGSVSQSVSEHVCLRSDDAKLMDNFISHIKIIIF